VMVGAYARHGSVAGGTRWAHEVLERLHMADRRDELARNLTLADLKRLEIARAVATQPDLILLDEVVAGLTPTEVEEMMSVLRNIRAGGITLLMIEHVMQAVMTLSDVIVVLHHGEKIFEGTPQAAAKSPQVIEAYLGEELLLA
jgi:branched-chain amino acid transport system ATP-binding protein